MTLADFDWPTIIATLTSSIIGGLIAVRIAQLQSKAVDKIEQYKALKQVTLELIEAIDSFPTSPIATITIKPNREDNG